MSHVASSIMQILPTRRMRNGQKLLFPSSQGTSCTGSKGRCQTQSQAQGKSNASSGGTCCGIAVKPIRHPTGVSPNAGTREDLRDSARKRVAVPGLNALKSVHFPQTKEFEETVKRHLGNPSRKVREVNVAGAGEAEAAEDGRGLLTLQP